MNTALKAIILAAGKGSRLGLLTADRPKSLVPIKGKPLLEWQLEALRAAGLSEIAVVRGYKSELVDPAGVTFFENNRWNSSNMLVTLIQARAWLNKYPCVVCYSDILYSAKIISRLGQSGGNIVIPYYIRWRDLWENRFDDPLADAETFQTDSTGRLIEIGGRAQRLDDIHGQYMGILLFRPEGWAEVERVLKGFSSAELDKMDMTGLLRKIIPTVRVDTLASGDDWFEVDNERDLKLVEAKFMPEIISSGVSKKKI